MPTQLAALTLRWLTLPFLLVMAAMASIDAPLKTAAAPRGIVSFELCAISANCSDILASWSASQREHAMLGLGLDYLYLCLYSSVIAAALLQLSSGLPEGQRRAMRRIAALLPVVALADALENYGLIKILTSGQLQGYAELSAACASLKFALLALALLALGVAGVLRLGRRGGAA